MVLVRYGDHDLELRVWDEGRPEDGNGSPPQGRPRTEPGRGLLGMRERVRLFGGELRAGPEPDGSFTVTARIPFGTVGP